MFAVLHVPRFALQAVLRHTPELDASPVVLVDPSLTTPRITEMNGLARAASVELGFTAPQALARCTGLVVRHRSSRAEEEAEAALVQCAYGFSPNVEWTGPGWVTLELRGLSELGVTPDPATLEAWAARLQSAATALGMACRVGVGPGPGVARHAASAVGVHPELVMREGRLPSGGDVKTPAEGSGPTSLTTNSGCTPALPTREGSIRVVTEAGAETFVAGLPVSVLDPTPHTARLLAKWGVRTVGEFKALGQAELADRLGLEAFALWAAGSSRDSRPLRLVRPPELYREGCELDPPVETLEPLLFLLQRFVDSLERRLEPSGKAVGGLILQLRQESGDLLERRLRVPQPTRRADVLFRMLHTHLEGVRTHTAISGVSLEAETVRPNQHQFSLFEAALRDPHQFQETLARLSALVGSDHVGSPVRREGHQPDRFQLVPPDFENAPPTTGRRTPELLRPTAVRRLRPPLPATVETRGLSPALQRRAIPEATGSARPPKPGPVFRPAEIAALLDPIFRPAVPGDTADPKVTAFPGFQPGMAGNVPTGADADAAAGTDPGQPVGVRCEWVQGRVTMASGPWCSSGNWWDEHAWVRTEWDVSIRGTVPVRLAWDGTEWRVEAVLD